MPDKKGGRECQSEPLSPLMKRKILLSSFFLKILGVFFFPFYFANYVPYQGLNEKELRGYGEGGWKLKDVMAPSSS